MADIAPPPLFPNSVVSNDIDFITAGDPGTFLSLDFTGRARMEMPGDGRPGLFQDVVYVFDMTFSDGTSVQIRADETFPTLDAARAEAEHFAGPLGKLPGFMRDRLSHVILNIGDRGAFGEAEGRFFVVSTENMATRRANHDMEETIFHETVHATLDALYLTDDRWLAAQASDGVFITEYAQRRSDKEDLAETALFYYTFRTNPERLDPHILASMQLHLPARIEFLDTVFNYDVPPGSPGSINPVFGTDIAEKLLGGPAIDIVFADGGDDTVLGFDGNDHIETADGNDKIWAGTGNDKVVSKGGDDTVGGSTGNDTVWAGKGNDLVHGAAGHDVIAGADGNDRLWCGFGNDTAYGSTGADTIAGAAGDDEIWGGAGDDAVFGAEGRDTIHGGSGNDTLYGGSMNDTVSGGAGNDLLLGVAGADRLDGQGGNDTLSGGTGSDLFVFSPGTDVVQDFDASDPMEQIDLGSAEGISDFTDLFDNHMSQIGTNVAITDDSGASMLLMGVSMASLDISDFQF